MDSDTIDMSQGTNPPRGPGAGPGHDDPAKRRPGLGRGLMALLGDEAGGKESAERPAATRSLPVEQLHPGRFQPRQKFDDDAFKSLVESVREKGILQPILVRRDPDNPHLYEIVAGERRWRAAQSVQLHEVPVVIRDMEDRDALEIALVENIQRQDLTAIEEAEGYRRLMVEFGHTQDALSKAVGKSRSYIANSLRLLSLPQAVRDMVQEGQLSAGHARALVGTANPFDTARSVVRRGLNVRQLEKLIKAGKVTERGRTSPGGAAAQKDADTLAVERELSNLLGLEVKVSFRDGGGTLAIHYRTLDQLDEVLRRLSQAYGKPVG